MRRYFIRFRTESEFEGIEAVGSLLALAATGVTVQRTGTDIAELRIDPSDWGATELMAAMTAWRAICRVQLTALRAELLDLDLRPLLREIANRSTASHDASIALICRAASGSANSD